MNAECIAPPYTALAYVRIFVFVLFSPSTFLCLHDVLGTSLLWYALCRAHHRRQTTVRFRAANIYVCANVVCKYTVQFVVTQIFLHFMCHVSGMNKNAK